MSSFGYLISRFFMKREVSKDAKSHIDNFRIGPLKEGNKFGH
jgi:hypothetical protein